MDKHNVNRTITFNRSCKCVEGKSEWKKTAYGAKHMPKQKTISNAKSISILGISVADSGQHTLTCFIQKDTVTDSGQKMQHLRIS